MDLHSTLYQACQDDLVRIGVKRLRDQASILDVLRTLGFRKPWLAESRQFIRDTITANRAAFDRLADTICIHTVDDGRELFWDGMGRLRDADFYNDSEIMYDLQMNNDLFRDLLPGL